MNASIAAAYFRPDPRAVPDNSSGRLHPATSRTRSLIGLSAGLALLGAAAVPLPAAEEGDDVAVYASVSPDYARTRLPGGGFKTETYAFGEGGNLGGIQRDLTVDRLDFPAIAQRLAPALAAQHYQPGPTRDPRATDLLIMVYWGTTTGTDSSLSSSRYQDTQGLVPPAPPPAVPTFVSDTGGGYSTGADQGVPLILRLADDAVTQQTVILNHIANRQRDHQSRDNAALLGYLPEMQRMAAYAGTALEQRRRDLVAEVEESRYFVVLLAYDFNALRQHQGRKLRWEARFSLREHRNDFGRQLTAMAETASRYFGQDSQGLRRKPLPATSVRLGDLQILGPAPESRK